MKTDESNATSSFMPSGSVARIFSISAFATVATESVLAVDCLTMPRPTPGWLFLRITLR